MPVDAEVAHELRDDHAAGEHPRAGEQPPAGETARAESGRAGTHRRELLEFASDPEYQAVLPGFAACPRTATCRRRPRRWTSSSSAPACRTCSPLRAKDISGAATATGPDRSASRRSRASGRPLERGGGAQASGDRAAHRRRQSRAEPLPAETAPSRGGGPTRTTARGAGRRATTRNGRCWRPGSVATGKAPVARDGRSRPRAEARCETLGAATCGWLADSTLGSGAHRPPDL